MSKALETAHDFGVAGNQQKARIATGALINALFTLLSRIFGMLRDVMIFHIFGATYLTDAFTVAFTIPNVLRQFFGEGSFGVAFVPVYMKTHEHEGEHEARQFFKDAFGTLLLGLLVITVLGMIFANAWVYLFASGFSDNPEQLALCVQMTRWLFPYVLMVSLVALFGAYLNCFSRYAAMAAAPIFLNVASIILMVYIPHWFKPPIMVLVGGVIVGGILQLFLMILALLKENLWSLPSFSWSTPAMKSLLRLLGPALFGVFVYQLNIIVLRQLASYLSEGQVSYYYNADRLTQFATGVFAISIATAALPELSRSLAQNGREALGHTLTFTLRIISFIVTPSALGLMVFALPIVAVIFQHGAYNQTDAEITAKTLIAFAPSLVAVSFSRSLIQSFYALGDTKTPVFVGILVVLANLFLGLWLVNFDVPGLALTLSLSSFLQFGVLLMLLKKKLPTQNLSEFLKPFGIHVGISCIACGVGLFFAKLGHFENGLDARNILVLGIIVSATALAYFGFSYYFNVFEAQKLVEICLKRVKGKA